MPLIRGSSERSKSTNMKRMMDEYAKSGKIGRITPRSKDHAMSIAQAIMMRMAERGPVKKKSKKKGK